MSTKRVSEMTDEEIRDMCGSRVVPDYAGRQAADRAAEAVRLLNYLTLPGDGYPGLRYPADAYDIIGGVKVMAQRLPQLLTQVAGWLEAEQKAGRIAHDSGGSAQQSVTTTCSRLAGAAAAAETVADLLASAQNEASHLKAADVGESQRDQD